MVLLANGNGVVTSGVNTKRRINPVEGEKEKVKSLPMRVLGFDLARLVPKPIRNFFRTTYRIAGIIGLSALGTLGAVYLALNDKEKGFLREYCIQRLNSFAEALGEEAGNKLWDNVENGLNGSPLRFNNNNPEDPAEAALNSCIRTLEQNFSNWVRNPQNYARMCYTLAHRAHDAALEEIADGILREDQLYDGRPIVIATEGMIELALQRGVSLEDMVAKEYNGQVTVVTPEEIREYGRRISENPGNSIYRALVGDAAIITARLLKETFDKNPELKSRTVGNISSLVNEAMREAERLDGVALDKQNEVNQLLKTYLDLIKEGLRENARDNQGKITFARKDILIYSDGNAFYIFPTWLEVIRPGLQALRELRSVDLDPRGLGFRFNPGNFIFSPVGEIGYSTLFGIVRGDEDFEDIFNTLINGEKHGEAWERDYVQLAMKGDAMSLDYAYYSIVFSEGKFPPGLENWRENGEHNRFLNAIKIRAREFYSIASGLAQQEGRQEHSEILGKNAEKIENGDVCNVIFLERNRDARRDIESLLERYSQLRRR